QLDQGAHRIDPDALDELLDQRAVELAVAPIVQHIECIRRRKSLTVGPGGREGVETVDEPRDAAEQADFGALQALGIAAAVDALVMQGRERRQLGRQPGAHGQDGDRMTHVALADIELRLAQRLFLVQQLGWQTDLSHILQQAEHPEQIDLLARQVQEARKGEHVDRNPEGAVERVPAALLHFREQQHGIWIAYDAVRHARHGLAHTRRIDRLAGLCRIEHVLQNERGLLLRLARDGRFRLEARLFLVVDLRLDGCEHAGAERPPAEGVFPPHVHALVRVYEYL